MESHPEKDIGKVLVEKKREERKGGVDGGRGEKRGSRERPLLNPSQDSLCHKAVKNWILPITCDLGHRFPLELPGKNSAHPAPSIKG